MKLAASVIALATAATGFSPAFVQRQNTALFNGPVKGAGGMFDTRDPEPFKHEDPRKSISAAPSFEEYLKMRDGGGAAPAPAPAAAVPAPAPAAPAPAPMSYGPSWAQPRAPAPAPAAPAPMNYGPSWAQPAAPAPAPAAPAMNYGPSWAKPAAPAPAPAAPAHSGPAKGAGGMFDTRDPEPFKHEDPRKSISAAPSFEEYLKSRQN